MMEARLPLIFLALAIIGGLLAVALNPPLRGPDEPAHFLRALGIAQGQFVPHTVDARGRRGIYLSPELFSGFGLFNAIREAKPSGSIYADAFARYFAHADSEPEGGPPVFVPYEGSESYSPVPYLPYVPAALISKAMGLKFVATLYVMRLAGLFASAALGAYAIAVAPHLKWIFFCTAMLPTAIYQRAVINADGASLSLALLVIAFCIRGIHHSGGIWRRMGWMTACALTKPPQVALAVLELMTGRDKNGSTWARAALVMLPGFALSLAWILLSAADVGAWRISESSGLPAHEFDPIWKLTYLLHHLLAFAEMSITSLDYAPELWRQLIGVFGWLDVPMRAWAYPAISVLLAPCFVGALGLSGTARARAAVVAVATALAYCCAVFIIFFVTLTPTTADRIHGLQGRYFLVLLPLLAIVLIAMLNHRGPGGLHAVSGLAGAFVSMLAMAEALWHAHWAG
jgi:uncharacterized membrane protein